MKFSGHFGTSFHSERQFSDRPLRDERRAEIKLFIFSSSRTSRYVMSGRLKLIESQLIESQLIESQQIKSQLLEKLFEINLVNWVLGGCEVPIGEARR